MDNLFRESIVAKEYEGKNLVFSSDRNKLVIDIFQNRERVKKWLDAGTCIKWPRIHILPPSLIVSYISIASQAFSDSSCIWKSLIKFGIENFSWQNDRYYAQMDFLSIVPMQWCWWCNKKSHHVIMIDNQITDKPHASNASIFSL